MDLATRSETVGWAAALTFFFGSGLPFRWWGVVAAAMYACVAIALVRLQRTATTTSPGLDLRWPLAATGAGGLLRLAMTLAPTTGRAQALAVGVLLLVQVLGAQRYTAAMASWCRTNSWSPARAYTRAGTIALVALGLVAVATALIAAGHPRGADDGTFWVGSSTWAAAGPTWFDGILFGTGTVVVLWTLARVQFAQKELRDGLTAGADHVPAGFTPI